MTKPITCAENDPDSVGYVPDATPEQRAEFARRAERLDRVDAALAKRLADVLAENFAMLDQLAKAQGDIKDLMEDHRELHRVREQLDKAEKLLALSETALGKALHENAALRTRLSITNDHQKEQPMTNSP